MTRKSWDSHPKWLMTWFYTVVYETAPKGITVQITLDIYTM